MHPIIRHLQISTVIVSAQTRKLVAAAEAERVPKLLKRAELFVSALVSDSES